MNLFLLVALIFEAVFAIGFLFIPGVLLGTFGVTLDETSTVLAHLFGSALLAFPFLLWFARKSAQLAFKKAAAFTLFVYYLVSTMLLLSTQLRGLMNPAGWSVVVLHILLTLWSGYYILK
jgi:hypothetical protein